MEINGIQQFESYDCTVKADGDRLNFYFLSDSAPDEGGSGQRNNQKFKKGALLFSLIRTRVGKSTKYLFEGADFAIKRLSRTKAKEAVYFEKM